MNQSKKKTKKKIFLNGIPKKIDYDAYVVISNQESQLKSHEEALFRYVLLYEVNKKHTEDETILYNYCMQFSAITESLKQSKEEETKTVKI